MLRTNTTNEDTGIYTTVAFMAAIAIFVYLIHSFVAGVWRCIKK